MFINRSSCSYIKWNLALRHEHFAPSLLGIFWSSLCLRGHHLKKTWRSNRKRPGAEEKKKLFLRLHLDNETVPPSSHPVIYRLSLWPAEAWRWCVMCFCFTSRLWKSAFYGQALCYVFRAIREEIYWLIMAGQVQRRERRMYKCNTRAQRRHRARLSPSCQAHRPLQVLSSSWSHLCVGFNAQVAGSVLNLLIKNGGQKRSGSELELQHRTITSHVAWRKFKPG